MKKLIWDFKRICIMVREFSQEADEILLENSENLEKGVWRAHASNMLFYKKGHKKQLSIEVKGVYYARAIYGNTDGSTRLARWLFSFLYRRRICGGSGFNAQILILSSARSVTRYVNASKNILLAKFSNHSIMEQREAKKKLLSSFFKTVPLIMIDNENCCTVEQFIKKQPCSDDKKFRHILKDYCSFSSVTKCKLINKNFSEQEKQMLLSRCRTMGIEDIGRRAISWIESSNYRICLSHGDISPLNVIYDGKDFYYIDFETVGERVFFYDLIEYLSWCACNKKNDLLILFLSGVYDEAFKDIFANYGVPYKTEDRRVYLMVYAIERGWGKYDTGVSLYDKLLQLSEE